MRNVEMILLWVEVIVWPEPINREQDDVARDSLSLQRIWGEESPEKDEKKDKFIGLFYGCHVEPHFPRFCPKSDSTKFRHLSCGYKSPRAARAPL